MTKKVYVTAAQTDAARMVVERSAAAGKLVSPSVSKIANARAPRTSMTANTTATGKTTVSKTSAQRSGLLKRAAKSARTGAFVTKNGVQDSSQKSK